MGNVGVRCAATATVQAIWRVQSIESVQRVGGWRKRCRYSRFSELTGAVVVCTWVKYITQKQSGAFVKLYIASEGVNTGDKSIWGRRFGDLTLGATTQKDLVFLRDGQWGRKSSHVSYLAPYRTDNKTHFFFLAHTKERARRRQHDWSSAMELSSRRNSNFF